MSLHIKSLHQDTAALSKYKLDITEIEELVADLWSYTKTLYSFYWSHGVAIVRNGLLVLVIGIIQAQFLMTAIKNVHIKLAAIHFKNKKGKCHN